MCLIRDFFYLQAALQYFCAAEGCTNSEDIKDSGTRVLAAQCYALIGMSKLQEANATRVRSCCTSTLLCHTDLDAAKHNHIIIVYYTQNAEDELRQRADAMADKLSDLEAKSSEYSRLLQRLDETRYGMPISRYLLELRFLV